MKKKSLFTAMAGAMAVGLGMVSAPSTQQVIEQTQASGVTVQQQQANHQRTVRSQQAQQRASQEVQYSLTNPYAPVGGGGAALWWLV